MLNARANTSTSGKVIATKQQFCSLKNFGTTLYLVRRTKQLHMIRLKGKIILVDDDSYEKELVQRALEKKGMGF